MRFSSQKGVTLLELTIALAITAVIGLILVGIITQNNGLVYKEQAQVSQGLSLNTATSLISDAIHNASAISATCPLTVCQSSFNTGQHTIVLSTPAIDASDKIIQNVYDYIVIAPDTTNSTILRKIIYPDAASKRSKLNQVLSTDLSSITFYYYNSLGEVVAPTSADQVNFVINLKQQVGLNPTTSSSSGQVNLRNN